MNINQLILPLNIEKLIKEDDSVRLLEEITSKLDFSSLKRKYKSVGRNHKYYPETLFKIMIYGYMNQIYSSRKIEKACQRDVNFMWLLGNESAPDHNTINRFRNKLKDEIESLFYQLISLLGEMDEIKYKHIFIDGTKIEANANKYTFVWKKAVSKNEIKLQEKSKETLVYLENHYKFDIYNNEKSVDVEIISNFLERLCEIKELEKIEFVYGKGKRKTPLQRDIQTLESYKERLEKYNHYNEIFDGRNSFSKTDHDATFMHMKEDHMRNSQLKPGYNIQIGVEGEYIVGADISSERSDQLTLIPFLEKLKSNQDIKYENIIADAGYESEENYIYLEKENQNSYIKPQNYEISKKRNYKNKINLRENMTYDELNDYYICHNNKKLIHISNTTRKSKSGYKSDIKIYECESCEGCNIKEKCTRSKYNRKLYVSEEFIKQRRNSETNITTENGKQLRMNRSIQVEGAFGVLKQDYGFRRFLTKGKNNVMTEILLLIFGYNINKLHNKMKNKKCGFMLHPLKVA